MTPPEGLLEQQQSALAIDAATRAATARNAPSLMQQGVVEVQRHRAIPLTALAAERGIAMGPAGQVGVIILDPFAGSGSYVRAAVRRSGSFLVEPQERSGLFEIGAGGAVTGGSLARSPGHRELPMDARLVAAPMTIQQRDVVSRVAAIRDLIQHEQIQTARKLLELIPIEVSEEPAITRLRRALMPPTVRSSTRKDIDRRLAYDWLRQHAREYRGQWVAVAEDHLVAAAPTLKQLRAQLQALAPAEQPLIHKL